MDKERKKKFPWITLIFILICCQYVAAHVSRWYLTAGELDISKFGDLETVFSEYPFDFVSFHPVCYICVYMCGLWLYARIVYKFRPQKAEMKGKEHGSGRLMTPYEMAEFRRTRITPDFPYSTDCTQTAVYPKEVLAREKKRKRKGR